MSNCYYDSEGCLVCPEQQGSPYVPARIEHQVVFGWNAGANSITMLDGDMRAVLDMPLGVLGVIIGLKGGRKQQTVPALVEHGWYFQRKGGLDLVQPIERGVVIGAPITGRSAVTTFEIRRAGEKVTYHMGGALMHTSETASVGTKVVNACLYASGDGAPSGPASGGGGGGGGGEGPPA